MAAKFAIYSPFFAIAAAAICHLPQPHRLLLEEKDLRTEITIGKPKGIPASSMHRSHCFISRPHLQSIVGADLVSAHGSTQGAPLPPYPTVR